MRPIRRIHLLLALVAALIVSGPALAQRHHARSSVHFGFVFGGPVYYPGPYYYYPPPYYYYPPPVVIPQQPQTYIEKGDVAESDAAQSYWYYCPGAKAYYPYVKQCPGGWQRVTPQPPPG